MFVVGIFSQAKSTLHLYIKQPHSYGLRESSALLVGMVNTSQAPYIAKASSQVFALAENLQIFVVDVDI